MEIRIRVPRIAAGAMSNLVGLLGLLSIVVAVGGLTHNVWWAVLTGGAFSLTLAALAQAGAESAPAKAPTVAVAATNFRPAAAQAKEAKAS